MLLSGAAGQSKRAIRPGTRSDSPEGSARGSTHRVDGGAPIGAEEDASVRKADQDRRVWVVKKTGRSSTVQPNACRQLSKKSETDTRWTKRLMPPRGRLPAGSNPSRPAGTAANDSHRGTLLEVVHRTGFGMHSEALRQGGARDVEGGEQDPSFGLAREGDREHSRDPRWALSPVGAGDGERAGRALRTRDRDRSVRAIRGLGHVTWQPGIARSGQCEEFRPPRRGRWDPGTGAHLAASRGVQPKYWSACVRTSRPPRTGVAYGRGRSAAPSATTAAPKSRMSTGPPVTDRPDLELGAGWTFLDSVSRRPLTSGSTSGPRRPHRHSLDLGQGRRGRPAEAPPPAG
jgi:hypothetical protein